MTERLDRIEKLLEKAVVDTQNLKVWIQELKESQAKTDEQMKKTDEQMKDSMKETKDLKNELRWMWLTQWAISEDIMSENFIEAFEKEWEDITTIQTNIKVYSKRKRKAEIDIIWINGTKLFIWETKTKLTKEHIKKLLEDTIPKFKKYLHKQRYGWLDIYWVVWTRVFADKEVKDYAKKKGLYILKEQHNWNAKILKESLKTLKSL